MSTSRQDLRTAGDLVMAPRVPHGLAAAVEGLTREVIRHRPEDIYVFAAQHFEELLKLRDEYGAVTNLPGRSTNNNSALREMNKSLKKRSGTDKTGERGGWSMNETARVLERHRSIFGDKGRKVSPDEVRALGNEKENKSGVEALVTSTRRRPGSNERFVRRKVMPNENSPENQEANKPKIISQIPTLNQAGGLLAKDIKSELRKNRNSSRDRRSMRERAERKSTERLEITSRQGGAIKKTLTRSSRERSLDKLMDVVENDADGLGANNQKQKTDARASGPRAFSKVPRTLSMDRVREFVVRKFRSSESWEELTSTDYVNRVQEVIDDAAPSILRKVNELSTRSAGRGGRGYESVDESTSTSTRSDKSNQTDDVRSRSAMSGSRRSRKSRRTKSKTSGADSLEGIETLASETEQVKDTGNEAEASPSPSLSLPAVRPPSSKNHSRSVSRSDSDNLVLPPIPPEGQKSAKLREELVLPSLQVSREVPRASDDVELRLPDPPTDEIFKDSLNVTPEIAGSPRPDSLEPGDKVEIETEVRDIDTGKAPASVREKLMEIQEAEERLRNILDSGNKEERQEELGMKMKLVEIEETEKRIEKILDPDVKNQKDLGMREKLIEIEETEKRIEKLFKPDSQDVQEDEKDFGMKEKLIEIQESEKRIENILNPETQEIEKDESAAGFMKDKLMEIEEAEKRLRNVFNSTPVKETKPNQDLKAHHSAPKTPFIPEIPSEYVTLANHAVPTPDGAKHPGDPKDNQLPRQLNNAENTNDELKEPNGREVEPNFEILSSGTPESLGTSYVLTEGSPYEIPDSVTTVIIPERQIDTPSSDIVEIVLEDDHEVRFKKSEDHPEEKSQISLRNILDNFGEIVDQETPVGSSATDVDFIRNLQTPNDVIIARTDLDQIREEVANEIAETEPVSIALANIAESEETIELQEAEGGSGERRTGNSEKLEDLKSLGNESLKEHEQLLHVEEPKEVSEDRNTETSGSLDHEVKPEDVGNPEQGRSSDPEVRNRKFINITDSGTTESTDEVKETTISDDGGNTAAESSVTSPSCGGDIGARNSESSNEVKETTISDQPVDETGKHLLSLAPQCFGSMPHVPELNLDSLQDITVSSFQLSDDQTAEEDSEAGPPQSGNEASHDSQDHEPVYEEIIVKEKLAVKEDACTKINAYLTEPDTEDADAKSVETESSGVVHEADTSEPGKTELEVLADKANQESGDVLEKVLEASRGEVAKGLLAEKEPDEERIEVREDVTEKVDEKVSETESNEIIEAIVLGDVSKEVSEKSSKDVSEKESKEKSEDVHEIVLKTTTEVIAEKTSGEVHEETSSDLVKEVPEEQSEVEHEKIIEVEDVTKKVLGEKSEELVVKDVTENGLGDMSEDVTNKLSEEESGVIVEIGLRNNHEEIARKVSDEVHEEMSEQEAIKVSEEEPEEFSEDVIEKVLEEKVEIVDKEEPGMEPEKILEEASKVVVASLPEGELKTNSETKPEDKPDANIENKREENPDQVLGTVSGKLVEEDTKKELEGVHEKVAEMVLEEKRRTKREGSGEMVHDVAKEEPEEVHEMVAEKVLEEKPEVNLEEKTEEVLGTISTEMADKEIKGKPEGVIPNSTVSEMDAVGSASSSEIEKGKRSAKDVGVQKENQPESISISKPSVPEVGLSTSPAEVVDGLQASVKLDNLVEVLDPPKAEVVTNDLDDYTNYGERMEYHIYVPEVGAAISQDGNSTTESSTFNSAATKIQAGVRGFLTRRRLQSAQRRSSTLDSVPSIQDSVAADASHLEPIEEVGLAQAATTIQSNYRGYKARQRLRREDAVQKTTMSVENAFGGNGLQHTGEFHDCLPLPPLQLTDVERSEESGKSTELNSSQKKRDGGTESSRATSVATKEESPNDEQTLALTSKQNQEMNFVVVSGNDSALQSQYLNFITSIEEVPDESEHSIIQDVPDTLKVIDPFSTLKSTAGIESLPLDNPSLDSSVSVREPLAVPGTPTGLIIEELSKTDDESLVAVPISDSLDLPGLSLEGIVKDRSEICGAEGNEKGDVGHEASLGTMSFSMNVDDMLGLGAESDPTSKMKPILEVTLTPRDFLKLSNMSTSGDRVESPVTMMQIVPKSVDRSEEDRETEVKSVSGKVEDDGTEVADKSSKTFSIERNV